MPAWGSTDSIYSKPLFPVERQVREFVTLVTANTTNSGNTVIVFQGTGAATAANQGVVAGMYITTPGSGNRGVTSNTGVSGEPGFFVSNVAVVSVTGNVVVLSAATRGIISPGTTLEFDTAIVYPANTVANTYNQDTILVTPTRLANNTVNVSKTSTGWMYVLKTTNGGDGAVRYRTEVLVALANTLATNTASGNTSTGRIFSGV